MDRNAEIVQRAAAGEPITALARDYGVSRQRISQIVHKRGLRLDTRHMERWSAIGRRNQSEVHRRYEAGESVAEIAAAVGIEEGTVGAHLVALGYDRRPPPSAHGTTGRYDNYRCRCELCREANKARIRKYRNRPNGKARVAAETRAYRRRHPDRMRVYGIVQTAVRNGTLTLPDRCSCGRAARVTAHHDDYAKPLDVMWLCGVCHKLRHQMLKRLKAA